MRLSPSLRLPLLFLGTALVPLSGVARAAGPLTPLDTTVGTYGGVVVSVANDGTAVGDIYGGPGGIGAYWNGSGVETSIPSTAADVPEVEAISADASTIVGDWEFVSDGSHHAFAYQPGATAPVFLPALSAEDAGANGTDANGAVIVGESFDGAHVSHAVSWSGNNWGTITSLDPLAAGKNAVAAGISDDDSIIVGTANAADNSPHVVYWGGASPTAVTDLGQGFASAISGDGSTIVGLSSFDPVKFSGPSFSVVTDLGGLTPSGGGEAAGVNEDGSIIVGDSTASDGHFHAFRYADGQMSDLNLLLANAGVDMTGITLTKATAISSNGKYIAAIEDPLALNLAGPTVPYLIYYGTGAPALTDVAEQQASVDGLGHQRQALAVQQDAFNGTLIGDLDRNTDSDTAGVFGLVGSAAGGVHGRLGVADGFSLTGGVVDGRSEFAGAAIGNGLTAAVALRYDATGFAAGAFHPFAQAGGSFGLLDQISFTRSYPGGTGTGTTSGTLGSAFIRAGLSGDLDTGDQLELAAELGERWLSTGAYDEAASATNPFPASIAAGTDVATVGKLSAGFSHRLNDKLDLTLRAAVGKVLGGSSGLAVATTGFGTLGTGMDSAPWAEAGAHLAWSVGPQSTLDFYATGIAGSDVGTAAHIGAGYNYRF